MSGDYGDEKAYTSLSKKLGANRLFYLALPPELFLKAATNIQNTCKATRGFNRIVVEKPFGYDLESAKKLGKELGAVVPEKDLYRIDHYLGKQMVQNILVTRFANGPLERVWDRKSIAAVQITCKEKIGTEGRGGYFDASGILRDITQNHLTQIFSLIAMEPPKSLSPEDIRDAKVNLLKQTETLSPENTVLGQYTRANGSIGYTDDVTVPDTSVTPTFASTVLKVANARWSGVPFVLKAGKALNSAKVDVRVIFKKPANQLYTNSPGNELVFRVQPDEAVYHKLTMKVPGLSSNIHQSELDLQYSTRYKHLSMPDAYESLILDAVCGSRNNFVRQDELEEAWRIFTPLLKKIEAGGLAPLPYPRGSRGPAESDARITKVLDGVLKRDDKGYQWPTYNAKELQQVPLEKPDMALPFDKKEQEVLASANVPPEHFSAGREL
ncbi:Glucose-6-phosphate 1-dehydrogenase [Diplonema papillatum]|nr:Glucose-6-phosphate 1-dehydrogenase [Diplonema papillatum]